MYLKHAEMLAEMVAIVILENVKLGDNIPE